MALDNSPFPPEDSSGAPERLFLFCIAGNNVLTMNRCSEFGKRLRRFIGKHTNIQEVKLCCKNLCASGWMLDSLCELELPSSGA